MKTNQGLLRMLLLVLCAMFLVSSAAFAYDISGMVSYNGAKTGRIYISAHQDNNNNGYGVSITAPGPFTIRGIPDGTYTVGAFMDSVGDILLHASDPAGLTSNVNVSGANVTGVTVTLNNPASVAPVPPTDIHAVSTGNGTAAILWNSATVPYGPRYQAIVPDTYDIYWSTNPDVMSNVTGSMKNYPANENDNLTFLDGLTDNQTYYVLMTGATGTIISAGSTTAMVTISAPTGGHSVSGSVAYSGFDPGNKKLFVLLFGNDSISSYQITTLPASPTSPLQFTVPNVPNGTYWVYPVIASGPDDVGIGPQGQVPMITVSDADVSNVSVSLSAINAGVDVTTNHYKFLYGEGYNLDVNINSMMKKPVNVTFTGGPQVSGPIDIAIDPEQGSFMENFDVADRPTVGDSYSVFVTYSDASTETISAQVTDVLDSLPTAISPIGSIQYNATPTFTWEAPSFPPAGTYYYGLWLRGDNNGIWWNAWDLPNTQLSAVYNSVGDSSSPTLSTNASYWWGITVIDSKGNSAMHQIPFFMGSGISGKVTSDGVTGIGGVWVTVYTDTMTWINNTMTNADGTYSIGGLAAGSYKVFVDGSNKNYMNAWYDDGASVTVNSGQPTQNINITLSQSGSISGRVTNGTTGISNVGINVCQYDSGSGNCNWGYNGATTNGNGDYSISGLQTGQYKVQFNSGGTSYVGEWYNDKADMASADVVAVTMGATTSLADTVLVQGGGIYGRVTNGGTGVQDVWISACQYDSNTGNCMWVVNGTNTDANGNYTLGGLSAGQVKVWFNVKDYYMGQWYNGTTDMTLATAVTITVGVAAPLADTVLVQGGIISGSVTNGTTGIQNVTAFVCLYDSGAGTCNGVGSAVTDANGYVQGLLPAGEYRIQFRAGSVGYASEWYNDKANAASADPVTVSAGITTSLSDAVLVLKDTTPDAFSFTAQTNVPRNTLVSSNTITVSGINAPTSVSISNGEYSINNGVFTSSTGTTRNNDTIRVRQTSSSNFSTMTGATLDINGTTGTFNVSTEAMDTTPDNFSFTFQNGVALSTQVISNSIVVSGINAPASISITNGEYEINNNGVWDGAPGTVKNGDEVRVLVLSSANYSTPASATLTIGGVSRGFSVTTVASPASGVTFTPNVTSPQLIGNHDITFTANGSGGSGNYEYKFWLKTNGYWSQMRDYSPTNTWTWNTNGMAAGSYDLLVYARNAGSNAAYDVKNSLVYTLVATAPATGATITPNIVSPRIIGNNITFTATGSGGSGSYEYKFWLKTGGVWITVQDYSGTNTWTWNTNGATAGAYDVLVYVRNTGSSAASEALSSLTYILLANTAATGATLTPGTLSPQMIGNNNITFTAGGIGGSGSYEYMFWLKTIGVWNIVQNYSATNTWTWNTNGVAAGSYDVLVYVRNSGSGAAYEALNSLTYVLLASSPATGATIAPDIASPQVIGNNPTFTAGGVGGSGSYEYKFWLKTNGVWAMVRDYSKTNTWTWNTSATLAGTYGVQVQVRNAGSSAKYEAVKTMSYVLAPPPVSGATLVPDKASPQTAGANVTFTAGGVGGSGNYEYKFWIKAAGIWTVVQDYSTTNTYSWNTTGLTPGTYRAQVYVRNVGSTANYEAVLGMGYVVK